MIETTYLTIRTPESVDRSRRSPVSPDVLKRAGDIVREVRDGGETSLRQLALEYDDLDPEAPLVYTPDDFKRAYGQLPPVQRDPIESTANQIREFAEAQLNCLSELSTSVPGGRGGHRIQPVNTAGAYAPGGNYPLPSTVLMTVLPARVAGVDNVWVASPDPPDVTLAAAHVAEADGLLSAGGAHAIAALAYGIGAPPVSDVVVGPGSEWVTAGKKQVAGDCGIDFLAGPTELLLLTDDTADPDTAAADLLAQAEHAGDALPALVSTSTSFIKAVDQAIGKQLSDLATRDVAEQGIRNGFAVPVDDLTEAVSVSNRFAPEHLHVVVDDPDSLRDDLEHYGSLFLGRDTAEVFGDYGAGPNHTLPTGGSARYTAGLSVFHFVRVQTWLEMEGAIGPLDLSRNVPMMARMEGLEGHARSAERRVAPPDSPPEPDR